MSQKEYERAIKEHGEAHIDEKREAVKKKGAILRFMAFLQTHTVRLVHYCLVTSTPLDNTVAAIYALQMQWGEGREMSAGFRISVRCACLAFSQHSLFFLFYAGCSLFFFTLVLFCCVLQTMRTPKSYVYIYVYAEVERTPRRKVKRILGFFSFFYIKTRLISRKR